MLKIISIIEEHNYLQRCIQNIYKHLRRSLRILHWLKLTSPTLTPSVQPLTFLCKLLLRCLQLFWICPCRRLLLYIYILYIFKCPLSYKLNLTLLRAVSILKPPTPLHRLAPPDFFIYHFWNVGLNFCIVLNFVFWMFLNFCQTYLLVFCWGLDTTLNLSLGLIKCIYI